jgi:type II secretion system protein I
MKKFKKSLDSRGITLIEVMVAMLVLTVSLLMLLNLAMVALGGNDWANKATLASQMVQEKLEQLRASGPATLADGSDSAHGLTRTWNIRNAGNHQRRAEVTVQWRDLKGGDHTSSLASLIRTDSI